MHMESSLNYNMLKKLGIVIVTLYLSACGLDVDRVSKEIPNMTGTWLLENTITYTSKSDGQILKTTTNKIQTYIDDTENGIKNVTCLQIWNGTAEQNYDYSGTKTDTQYFPLGEIDTSDSYLFENGVLVQEFEEDATLEGINTRKSVRKTLTFVDSKDTIYADGTIYLSGPLEYSATAEICNQQVKQTQPNLNDHNTYIFTFPGQTPGENGEQGGIDIFFSFFGNPPPGLYNFGTSDTETGFLGVTMWVNAEGNIETFDNSGIDWFDESGWIDLISADENSFEGNFSITKKDDSVITGYISVDVSGLQ